MYNTKYLIIGAGISGLFFSISTDSEDYIIVEKEDTPGGYCRTHRNGEFVWDYAGHFFHFNNRQIREVFESEIREDDIVRCKKNTKICYRGRMIDYPFQKNIHQLEKDEFIDCLYDMYFRDTEDGGNSFAEMLYAKFGKSITDKFLKPYNEKLYACSIYDLDHKAMGRFFPFADFDDVMRNMKKTDNGSYNEYFEYPRKGAQFFTDILSDKIDPVRLHLKEEALKIDTKNRILWTDRDEYHYQYLINTTPLSHFMNMMGMKQTDVFTNNMVIVFNIGFDAPLEMQNVHWIYFPEKEFVFYRVGFYNHILGQEKGSIYVEIGCPGEKTFSESEMAGLFEQTICGLKQAGIMKNQNVAAWEYIPMNPAYVHLSTDGMKRTEQVLAECENMNIYSLGRYGRWTYCSMEDCMIFAGKLAEKLKNVTYRGE